MQNHAGGYKKSDICAFLEMKLVPNSYIHVSVSDSFISRIGLPIWLQTDPGNIEIDHRYMNLEIGARTLQFCFGNNEGSFLSRNT